MSILPYPQHAESHRVPTLEKAGATAAHSNTHDDPSPVVAPAGAEQRSPLRTLEGLLDKVGCKHIHGVIHEGRYSYALTFWTKETGWQIGKGSGKSLDEAYRNAIANRRAA